MVIMKKDFLDIQSLLEKAQELADKSGKEVFIIQDRFEKLVYVTSYYDPGNEEVLDSVLPRTALPEGVISLLEELVDELSIFVEGEYCDHSVGICYCLTRSRIRQAQEVITSQKHIGKKKDSIKKVEYEG